MEPGGGLQVTQGHRVESGEQAGLIRDIQLQPAPSGSGAGMPQRLPPPSGSGTRRGYRLRGREGPDLQKPRVSPAEGLLGPTGPGLGAHGSREKGAEATRD